MQRKDKIDYKRYHHIFGSSLQNRVNLVSGAITRSLTETAQVPMAAIRKR